MRAITAVIAAAGMFGALAAAGPARADEDDYDGGWRRHEWREQQWREQWWREHEQREWAARAYVPPTIVFAQPGYYAPPVYYAPPPAFYAAPPAYYAPPPAYEAPDVSVGFSFR